jgi:organic hydroperoxide reductase OsmC/OhrA
MSLHTASVSWKRDGPAFTKGRYSRVHQWRFDGGLTVPASSSPHVVRPPFADPSCIDPEEAFIAALSSCHMLWFLSLAAKAGYVVDRYEDAAEGVMEGDLDSGASITEVTLRPEVEFSGAPAPDDAAVTRLHHEAHELCFIARSVKARVVTAGTWRHANAP